MKGVKDILIKEVKETFRNPRYLIFTILFPLLIYPIMGYMFGFSFSTAQETISKGTVLVVDLDKSSFSNLLIDYLGKSGLNVVESDLNSLNDTEYLIAIIIPKGFSESILNGSQPVLKSRVNIGSISFMTMSIVSIPQSILEGFKKYIGSEILIENNIDPRIIYDPFRIDTLVYVREWGRLVPQPQLSMYIMNIYIWPWILFGLIISILQISTVFLSEEKEQKTLEILLTLPIDRKAIILGKILGSSIVAISATASYIVGFVLYIVLGSTFFSMVGGFTEILNIPLHAIILMSILFFLELLFTASLGLGIAVFAQDTKAAESLAGSFAMPLMLLILAGSMLDLESLPLIVKYIYYAIPYSYMIKAFEHMLLNDYSYFIFGSVITIIWLIIMLFIVSKIFSSEKLLTMRVRLWKRRRGVKE